MVSLRKFFSLNIARFNRLRKKPIREILTYFSKRSKIALLHVKDRIQISIFGADLKDTALLEKLKLDSDLKDVKQSLQDNNIDQAKAKFITHMKTRAKPVFLFNNSEKKMLLDAIAAISPNTQENTIKSADLILDHKFYLLGKEIQFAGEINWHFVGNGQSWPLSFSPNIDYMSPQKPGDIKLPWELNRTQHFVVLGKAYWYTGDEKYAKEFAEQLTSWIKANPYKFGINWMEGIETSLRLVSWLFAYSFFIESKFFEKIHFEFLKSAYLQTKFIEQHLSDKWQINNNHLIAEASGLIIMGVLFPEFNESLNWRKKGLSILEKELESQILLDGYTWENSIGYQKFVTDLIIFVCFLLKKNHLEIPESIHRKLEKMIDFIYNVTKHDGLIPLIGDDDDGRAFKLAESTYDDARLTITLGSYLFNNNHWPKIASEEVIWFLGKDALTNNIISSTVPPSSFFENSGLFVLRDDALFALLTVGPQNRKYLHAPHRHLDDLSVVFEAFKINFIVDSGTFTYSGDLESRIKFKGRFAHNTSIIDNTEPVNINQTFELPSSPMSSILGQIISEKYDWVSALYTGYKNVNHTRHLFLVKKRYLLIIDLFEGDTQSHSFDLYYHFGAGINVSTDNMNLIAEREQLKLKIIPLSDSNFKAEIINGSISPSYGVKTDSFVLNFRKIGSCPQIFATMLFPFEKSSTNEEIAKSIIVKLVDPIPDFLIDKTNRATIGIEVEIGEDSDFFVIYTLENGLMQGRYYRKHN